MTRTKEQADRKIAELDALRPSQFMSKEELIEFRERTWQKLLDAGLVSDKRTGQRAIRADGVVGTRGHYQKPRPKPEKPHNPDSPLWREWIEKRRTKKIFKDRLNDMPIVRRLHKKGLFKTDDHRREYMRNYMRDYNKRKKEAQSALEEPPN
jgi:hypothetical protein